MKIDGKYAPAFNGRGLVFDKIGEYDKACNDFNIAIDIEP